MLQLCRIKSKQHGTTLIEVIIYLALLSVIIGGFLVSFFNLIDSNSKTTNQVLAANDIKFVLSKIELSLRESQAISTPLLEESGSELRFAGPDGEIHFFLDSEILYMKRVGDDARPLNSESVPISSVLFEHLPDDSGADIVRTTLYSGGHDFTFSYLVTQ